jgi:hypothetical protein
MPPASVFISTPRLAAVRESDPVSLRPRLLHFETDESKGYPRVYTDTDEV